MNQFVDQISSMQRFNLTFSARSSMFGPFFVTDTQCAISRLNLLSMSGSAAVDPALGIPEVIILAAGAAAVLEAKPSSKKRPANTMSNSAAMPAEKKPRLAQPAQPHSAPASIDETILDIDEEDERLHLHHSTAAAAVQGVSCFPKPIK
jgi:hypothetical protein